MSKLELIDNEDWIRPSCLYDSLLQLSTWHDVRDAFVLRFASGRCEEVDKRQRRTSEGSILM